LFRENPYFGIGSYNFGYYYPLISDSQIFPTGVLSKRIINNVYVKILTENRAIVFLAFSLIPLVIIQKFLIKRSKKLLDVVALGLLVVIMIKWLAYPTYLLLYDWISIFFIRYILWRDDGGNKCSIFDPKYHGGAKVCNRNFQKN
jgi:hypothetical protein